MKCPQSQTRTTAVRTALIESTEPENVHSRSPKIVATTIAVRPLQAALLAGVFFVPLTLPAEEVVSVTAFVDSRQEQTGKLSRALWDYAEVGYQEKKSSALLQETLADNGFSVEPGVAGMPTAFVASYGSTGPVIGVLAEFDALPGISQDAVPRRKLIDGKGAAHACGHNLFGAGSVTAAIAIKDWLKRTGTPGTVRLFGTPAEEGGSGKVYMVRAGLFDDVDFVLHWHPADENAASARTTLANRSARFRFRGVSAHAASAPEKARSALDGVEAFNYMVNLMREHVPQETRIHYVITSGGSAPNVVPDFAEVYYYVRHPQARTLKEIWARVEAAARGAAMGAGVAVDWEIIHGNHPLLINETMSKRVDSILRDVGGIEYSEEEARFAAELHQTLVNPKLSLGSEREVQPFEVKLGYGSTDVGDVSIAVPTAEVRTATYVPGTSAHSWQSAAAAGTSIGVKGAQLAAKVLSLFAVELYSDANLRRDVRAEFERRRGDDFVYEALLGDRAPPLDYRK